MRRPLKFPPTLYGREEQITKLGAAYCQCREVERGQCVVIAGSSGSGKSSLVREFATKKNSSQNNHHASAENDDALLVFCEGKFNMHRTGEPYSAVVDAYNVLFCKVLASTPEGRRELAEALEKVALDESILYELLPRVCQVVDQKHEQPKLKEAPSSNKMSNALQRLESKASRLHSALFNLLRSVCRASRPVLLFLDDLQWADESSLEFIFKSLIENLGELQGLLLVLTFRDDEVDDNHALSVAMNESKNKISECLTEIEIRSLGLKTTNTFLSETLQRDDSETLPLAEVLFSKTGGNPFFLRQSLQILERSGLLFFSTTTFKWEWQDVERLRLEMGICDNVVDLVASSMKQMPQKCQQLLLIASFLGTQFRANILAEYFKRYSNGHDRESTAEIDISREEKDDIYTDSLGNEASIDEVLEVALEEGFLTRRSESSTYSWSHDRLQQAAYSLVSDENERISIHLHLGLTLKEIYAASPDQQWMLFLAADQLNKGSALIAQDERESLARLNLEASNLASSKSALIPAVNLLRQGIDLIDPSLRWRGNNYDLCLELFTSLAKIEVVLGNHQRGKQAIDAVLENGKSPVDTFKVQTILIESLAAQRRTDDVIVTACRVLSEYNLKFPKHPKKLHVRLAEYRFKRKYERLGLEGIMQLPNAVDAHAIRQTELLYKLAVVALTYDSRNLGALAALRACQICFSKGKHPTLPACLAVYSMVLGAWGREEEAFRFANASLATFEEFGKKSMHARVVTGLHGAVLPLRRSFHESLEPVLDAYRVGVETGDVEFGITSALWYCTYYTIVGLPLMPLLPDLRKFIDQVRSYQLSHTLLMTFLILHQMILNVQGDAADPTVLTGEVMDQQVALKSFEGRQLWSVKRDIFTARIQLACIFQNLDVGRQMIEALKEYPDDDLVVCRKHLRGSYIALMCFALAREYGDKRHLARGRQLLKAFRQQTKDGSANAHPIYMLLRAEDAAVRNKKNTDSVKPFYDDAIKMFSRSGLLHLAAMANERVGQVFLHHGDEATAMFYLSRSLNLYNDWGAAAKVNQMKEHYGKHVADAEVTARSAGLKARERLFEEDGVRLDKFDLDLGG